MVYELDTDFASEILRKQRVKELRAIKDTKRLALSEYLSADTRYRLNRRAIDLERHFSGGWD